MPQNGLPWVRLIKGFARNGKVLNVPTKKLLRALLPKNQVEYYDYILSLKPKRIIFNPGTENDDLIRMAKENGIQPVIACTLVMLGTGQY